MSDATHEGVAASCLQAMQDHLAQQNGQIQAMMGRLVDQAQVSAEQASVIAELQGGHEQESEVRQGERLDSVATKTYQPVSVARPTRSRQTEMRSLLQTGTYCRLLFNGFEAYSNNWATKTAMEAPKAPMKVPKRKVKPATCTKLTTLMTADVRSASPEPQYAFLDEARKE